MLASKDKRTRDFFYVKKKKKKTPSSLVNHYSKSIHDLVHGTVIMDPVLVSRPTFVHHCDPTRPDSAPPVSDIRQEPFQVI